MMLDLRGACRRLAHGKGLAALALTALALSAGVSSAVLAVAYHVHFRPLGYPAAGELLRITGRSTEIGAVVNVSPPDFRDLRRRASSLRAIAAVSPFSPQLTLSGAGDPAVLISRRISARYFETLDIPLLAGREFTDAEEQPPARPVVLSERFWRTRMARRDVIGQHLMLNEEPYEVIGIAPDREEVFGAPDIWLPMQFPSEQIRGLRFMAVVGRVAPGVAPAAVQAELDAIGAQLQREHPSTNARWTPVAAPLAETVAAPVRSSLRLAAAMVLVLWVAACASLAGLALARTLRRSSEFALRAALGARTRELLRAALVDQVILGAPGFVGAMVVSHWVAASLRLLGLSPPASE